MHHIHLSGVAIATQCVLMRRIGSPADGAHTCARMLRPAWLTHTQHARPLARAPACQRQQKIPSLRISVPTEEDMAVFARRLAATLRPGDVYLLSGDVGAGKSVFSRAFIRAAAEDETLPVPSPTFLLQNTYEGWSADQEDSEPVPIHHFDLYRLEGKTAASMARLDLKHSFTHAVCLVEWPERVPEDQVPVSRLHVHISISSSQPVANKASVAVVSELGDESDSEFADRRPRVVILTPQGPTWQGRVQQLHTELQGFTSESGGLHSLTAEAFTALWPCPAFDNATKHPLVQQRTTAIFTHLIDQL